MDITQARLRELISYDPVTGLFEWRPGTAACRSPGRRVGCHDKKGYLRISIDGRSYPAHHLAWLYVHGERPEQLDHKNRIKDDNRIDNLRKATHSQNTVNQKMRRTNTSGHKGVHFAKKYGKWCARIGMNGKRVLLGYFDTIDEAIIAYRSSAPKFHGVFVGTLDS